MPLYSVTRVPRISSSHDSGGRLEPLQLLNDRQQAALAVKPRFRRDVLPVQQEANEGRRRYRLHLAAQRVYGGAVNTGQDAAVAKLNFRLS